MRKEDSHVRSNHRETVTILNTTVPGQESNWAANGLGGRDKIFFGQK